MITSMWKIYHQSALNINTEQFRQSLSNSRASWHKNNSFLLSENKKCCLISFYLNPNLFINYKIWVFMRDLLLCIGQFWPNCCSRKDFREDLWKENDTNYHPCVRKTLNTLHSHRVQTEMVSNMWIIRSKCMQTNCRYLWVEMFFWKWQKVDSLDQRHI